MAHPFASQVSASKARRLRALGARAGKAHGASAMLHKKSYPKKGAGTDREFTISGKAAHRRADRKANGGPVKMADGGSVRKHKPAHTTNIIISHAGGRGGGGGAGGRPAVPPLGPPRPVPVPVNRPVPVPVPVRPPMGGPMP